MSDIIVLLVLMVLFIFVFSIKHGIDCYEADVTMAWTDMVEKIKPYRRLMDSFEDELRTSPHAVIALIEVASLRAYANKLIEAEEVDLIGVGRLDRQVQALVTIADSLQVQNEEQLEWVTKWAKSLRACQAEFGVSAGILMTNCAIYNDAITSFPGSAVNAVITRRSPIPDGLLY